MAKEKDETKSKSAPKEKAEAPKSAKPKKEKKSVEPTAPKKTRAERAKEMKTLGNLSPARGSHRNRKRLGRGIGSGLGKTGGKGHKGQLARKGGHVRAGFEGGQTPLYRRIPKRGFYSMNRVIYNIVNLDQLNGFEAGATVDAEALSKAGLLRNLKNPVKLLGRGTLEKKLNIVVSKASASAKAAVEKAGGAVEEK